MLPVPDSSPDQQLDALLNAFLEAPPAITVPPGFADQVCARLPHRRRLRDLHFTTAPSALGPRLLLISACLVLAAMLVFARLATGGGSFWTLAEVAASLQLLGFCCLLARHRPGAFR